MSNDWRQITCEEREELVSTLGRSYNGFHADTGIAVLASRTDLGSCNPIVDTTWGYTETEKPVLRDVRHPATDYLPGSGPKPDRKPCEHYVPVTCNCDQGPRRTDGVHHPDCNIVTQGSTS